MYAAKKIKYDIQKILDKSNRNFLTINAKAKFLT